MPTSILDQAKEELQNREQAFNAKITPLRDIIAYYENQIHLCQVAIDAIDAILAASPQSVVVDLGNPAPKGV